MSRASGRYGLCVECGRELPLESFAVRMYRKRWQKQWSYRWCKRCVEVFEHLLAENSVASQSMLFEPPDEVLA